jgi:serine phosphatase RsbU (regulator of sigma subunit)
MANELLIHCPDGQTKTVPLEGERFTLGRSSAAELCFPEDAGLSRQHLRFEREAGEWIVEDLGSKNGTTVNSSPLRGRWKLKPGDRIAAGHLVIDVDASERQPANVVFVEGETPSTSTVMTSLEGSLAQERLNRSGQGKHVSALINAGRELSLNQPLPDLFKTIIDLAVDAVGAKRGLLMLLQGDRLVAKAARGEGFTISSAVRDRVMNQNHSVLVRDTQRDDAFRARMSIVEQNIRTLMAVPLQLKDRAIGIVYVDSPSLLKEFTEDDLNLLTVMANVAAIRIENARLVEVEQAERILQRDLQQAAEIQRTFLPSDAPLVAGVELAGHNAPSRAVGGDYYDFFPYADGRVAMVLGDVSGKGMPASLMMMSLQARVRAMLEEPAELAGFMTKLNRMTAVNCPPNKFVTFFCSMLDPETGELRYCNAGHNPPMLVRGNGAVQTLVDGASVPLGIMPAARYRSSRVDLEPNDLFVLYSDGVTDATNPSEEEFGEERLQQLLAGFGGQSARAALDGILRAIQEWSAGSPQPDDITLIVARRA